MGRKRIVSDKEILNVIRTYPEFYLRVNYSALARRFDISDVGIRKRVLELARKSKENKRKIRLISYLHEVCRNDD